VGGISLRDRFPRIFSLAEDRWATVPKMEGRDWTVGGGAWVWRAPLRMGGGECGGVCCFFV